MALDLNRVTPDFEDIRSELMNIISSRTELKDFSTSSTGLMILELIAGVATYSVYHVERAVQENFLTTATKESSIKNLSKTLGVKLLRRRSSRVYVSLTNDSPTPSILLPDSEFPINIGGATYKFVNIDSYQFSGNATVSPIQLVQGDLKSFNFTASGEDYQKVYITDGWKFSEDYLKVSVDGEVYTRADKPLWNYSKDDKVYYDNMSVDGLLEIEFGSGINAFKPTPGSDIVVMLVETVGDESNYLDVGIPVGLGTLKGVTLTPIENGEDVKSISYYRKNSPKIFAAADRCVRRSDFKILNSYPGVIDIVAVGERELHPGDWRWMNVVGLVCLTTSVWSQSAIEDFLKFAEDQKVMFALKLLFIPAKRTLVKPIINIKSSKIYSSSSVETRLREQIDKYFSERKQVGVIGQNLYSSEISRLIMKVNGVAEFSIQSPEFETKCRYDEYLDLDPTYVINITRD